MAKKVQVSLREIGKQIERAEAKLSAGSRAVANREVKKELAVKIKSLKKVKKQLRQICRGTYNIKVPTS
jgi:predicted  nucleic acid-binding Zn-ribbon protein